MTEALFRSDAYLRQCPATVVAVNDRGRNVTPAGLLDIPTSYE